MKILNLQILLSLCMYFLVSASKSKKLNYSIIGAGPVGIYLSYLLLKNDKVGKITLYEKRGVIDARKIDETKFNRPQCLRLPFEIADSFDTNLKKQYWPEEKLRNTIFDSKKTEDPEFKEFWPNFGYQHFPRIKVGNLQIEMLNSLLTNYTNKFELKNEEVSEARYKEILESSDLVIISTGVSDLSKAIRKTDKIENTVKQSSLEYKDALDGVYLIYKNADFDDYKRDGKYMNRFELSKKGITYSATNNKEKSVQLYTYDVAGFKDLYKKIIPAFRIHSKWTSFVDYFSNKVNSKVKDEQLTKDDTDKIEAWNAEFKKILDEILKEFKIELPKNVQVHYAPRMYYAYNNTHNRAESNPKTVFVGDAMGGTDYKYGLNLGRGLYSAKQLVGYLIESNFDNKKALTSFQKYWKNVLKNEFKGVNHVLSDDLHIKYKYIVRGRTVDGTLYDEKKFQDFLTKTKSKDSKNKSLRKISLDSLN